jgi:hypothetical protein
VSPLRQHEHQLENKKIDAEIVVAVECKEANHMDDSMEIWNTPVGSVSKYVESQCDQDFGTGNTSPTKLDSSIYTAVVSLMDENPVLDVIDVNPPTAIATSNAKTVNIGEWPSQSLNDSINTSSAKKHLTEASLQNPSSPLVQTPYRNGIKPAISPTHADTPDMDVKSNDLVVAFKFSDGGVVLEKNAASASVPVEVSETVKTDRIIGGTQDILQSHLRALLPLAAESIERHHKQKQKQKHGIVIKPPSDDYYAPKQMQQQKMDSSNRYKTRSARNKTGHNASRKNPEEEEEKKKKERERSVEKVKKGGGYSEVIDVERNGVVVTLRFSCPSPPAA